MEVPFDPTAVRIGPLAIAWHGVFTSLGILAGLWLAGRLARRVGLEEGEVAGAAWWVVVGGLAGARLLYVFENAESFAGAPWRVLLIHEGGISVFGAVLGGAFGGALWEWRRSTGGRLLGVAAPGFLLGQAVGRVGDVINGEHRGVPAPGLPWAVTYTHPETLGDRGVPVHPAVAYELAWDLMAAGTVAWLLDRRLLPPMGAFWLGLLLYGLGRFWTGYFRLDERHALGLGLAQLIGLALVPVALAALLAVLRATRRASPRGAR